MLETVWVHFRLEVSRLMAKEMFLPSRDDRNTGWPPFFQAYSDFAALGMRANEKSFVFEVRSHNLGLRLAI